MTTSVYKFDDGRLLVKEATAIRSDYVGSGVPHRIGQISQVEQVLSVDTNYGQYGLVTPMSEVKVSNDNVFVVMRRGDLGSQYLLSGTFVSGRAAMGLLSGITSGLDYLSEVASGRTMSGLITLYTAVIGR